MADVVYLVSGGGGERHCPRRRPSLWALVWRGVFDGAVPRDAAWAQRAVKDLGLFLSASGQTFVYYSTDIRTNYYTGGAGLSYWVTPRLRLYGTYALRLNHAPAQPRMSYETDEVEHALSISAILRLP